MLVKKEAVMHFVSSFVEIAILDEEGEEAAPFVAKRIARIEYCPDGTHIRFYFDRTSFIAIPVTAKFTIKDDELLAADNDSKLQYVIRKVTN